MKKKFLLCLIVAAVCSLTALAACNNNDEPQGGTPVSAGYTIEVSETSLTLDVYEKYTLAAVVKNDKGEISDKAVEWNSSQSGVLTVDDGLLFAKQIGTAKVTAKVDGEDVYAEVNVTVSMRGYTPSLVLSESEELTLAVGSSFGLSPSVVFKGAPATDDDTTFIYSVGDTSIATVSDGTITAHKAGNTTITVTASWRGLGGAELVGSEDASGLRKTVELTVITVE